MLTAVRKIRERKAPPRKLIMPYVKDWRLIACQIELNIALCAMTHGTSLLFGVLSLYCLQFPQPQYRHASKGTGNIPAIHLA